MKRREGPKGMGISTREQRGMVLVVTLLVIIFLSLLGSTLLSLSLAENNISTNLVRSSKAFGIAEAGLEHARAELAGKDFNAILAAGGSLNFTGFGTTVSFAGGNYSVNITNNTTAIGAFPADPGGATNDTDNRIIITSTGTYQNAKKILETLVGFLNVNTPSPPAALALYGPDSSTKMEVKAGGNAEVNGNNYDPSSTYPCSGSACDGTLNDSVAAIAGILVNTSSFKSGGNVYGNPASTTDLTATATAWRNLANALTSAANITISGTKTIASNDVWGSPDQPVIVCLTGNSTDTVTITGTVNGAGILLINSDLEIQTLGNFNFQGIVIVMQNGKLNINLGGTSSIYGEVIADSTGPDAAIKVGLKGNAQIRYSQLAINRALNVSGAKVLTWREVPI